jgi:hypothetical protein
VNLKNSRPNNYKNWKPLGILLVLILGLSLFDLSLSSCASKSSPDGGPKDTVAPRLDTSFPPNKSLYFNSERIVLEFNEYLNLKSPQQQINISPLLAEDLEIISRGRKVEILLKDSLRPNTTYIISFGSSLTDLNEGNENKNFKYVFSTGSFLDSLHLSGTLKNAYTNEPIKNHLVGLYDVKKMESRDSFLLKSRPDYYAFTDESGSFGMSYLGAGNYFMAAFEDKGGTFKLPKKDAPVAFWTDTIKLQPDSLYRYDLQLFEPEARFRFLGARQKAAGRVQFAFNLPADSFKIEDINGKPDSAFTLWNKNHDTLNYYFSFAADTLNFRLNYDTVFVDSVITVRLRKMDVPPLKLKLSSNRYRSRDTVVLRSPARITKVNPDSIFTFTEKDTTSGLSLLADSADPFQWYILPPQKKSYRLRFKPGALSAEKRSLKDSFDLSVEILKGEDLGSLNFKVVSEPGENMILQIFNPQEKLILERAFSDSTQVTYRNVIPSTLTAYLIHDLDSNGSYTTGDFELARQPEKRVKYMEELEIRANWELDLEWRYRRPKAINRESLLNNDSTAIEK